MEAVFVIGVVSNGFFAPLACENFNLNKKERIHVVVLCLIPYFFIILTLSLCLSDGINGIIKWIKEGE